MSAEYVVHVARSRVVFSCSPGSVMLASCARSSASNVGTLLSICAPPSAGRPAIANITPLSMRSADSFMRCAASTLR